MHILLVADGRSPIARRWVQGLLALQHQVSFVSTYPCEKVPDVLEQHIIPVAFAGLAGSQVKSLGPNQPSPSRQAVARFRGLFLSGRYVLGPLSLLFYASGFRQLVNRLKPDLVHALRIPFEGMLASYTPSSVPVVVTVWGNDLTLHAHGSAWMRALTMRTLRRAAGLAADTQRDIRLGHQWGFFSNKPTLVVPGSGGIDLMEIHRVRMERAGAESDTLPAGVPFVVNPRGFRPGSVRNDVFFQSVPLVLDRKSNVHFICTAMAGQSEALSWIERLKIGSHVHLLPYVSQVQLWDLFLRAQVSVSISEHDGTPNSLLEAMACGCFPIAGDIESIREWITPGINGLLVEPSKPQVLAESILLALDQPELRSSAAEANLKIIQQHAEINLVRSQIQIFYQRLSL